MKTRLTLAAFVFFTTTLIADDQPKFQPLFNGKDLEGWKTHPDGQAKWLVENGCMTATGPAGHIFSERGDYTDFIFRIEAKINDGGNSGQYFRAQMGSSWPKGYEAQINSTHKDITKTGSLYPAFRNNLTDADKAKIVVTKALHKPDEWFTQEVTMKGNHIIIKVNGKTTVDFVDDKNTFAKGHFAIQHHDNGCKVMVRRVEVAEAKAKK